MYDRIDQWKEFSKQVELHIKQYTLLQYGNIEGTEQVDDFTTEDCWKNIERYINRRDKSARGPVEQLRDILKIAHYCNFLYDKYKIKQNMENVYETESK